MSIDEAVVAASRLCDAAEVARWRGADAYDGLWWPWPGVVVGGRRRRQVVMQLHARLPFDARRLYRREHPLIPKALGIYGTARTQLHALTGETRQREGALAALSELDADHTSGTPGWGYHWDTQTRWSFYPAYLPNVVATAFGASGLADAAAAFGIERFAARARAAAEWMQDALFDEELGVYCYHPGSRAVIHNASLLGASLALRELGQDAGVLDAVRRAVDRALAAQREDGAWPYGEGAGLGFVDSFHTAYVLDCLRHAVWLDPRVEEALERGTAYYAERFWGPGGEARLWPGKRYPEDAHAAGSGMTTLSGLVADGFASRDLLERITRRATQAMIRGEHAIYRRYRWGTTRVTYLRWADAHMALGLSTAALALRGRDQGEAGWTSVQ